MEYKPKLKRANLIPFGYYHPLGETRILLPDPKALDSLHYAFQMRSKYKTSYADCSMWLQRATGYKISTQGFKYLYDRWYKKIKVDKAKEIAAITKKTLLERERIMKEKFGDIGVITDDNRDIAALAYKQALKSWKTKEGSS